MFTAKEVDATKQQRKLKEGKGGALEGEVAVQVSVGFNKVEGKRLKREEKQGVHRNVVTEPIELVPAIPCYVSLCFFNEAFDLEVLL